MIPKACGSHEPRLGVGKHAAEGSADDRHQGLQAGTETVRVCGNRFFVFLDYDGGIIGHYRKNGRL